MKIIKKIAAIMLSVMMVLGMCSVVGAEGAGTTSGTSAPTGSITINNATPGETYKIYRILDLESYNETTGNYAYKLRTDKLSGSKKSWSDFIKSSEIENVYVTLVGDYVTWKDTADVAQFAKLALKYAKETSTKIDADKTATAPAATTGETTSTVTFTDLPLGYYLVETSVGTVLALNTTNSTWTIEDKNKAPTVEKKVQEDSTSAWESSNTADIGQTVNFKTTITAQAGAQNYVLHDEMDAGLTFGSITGIKKNDEPTDIENRFYNVKRSIDTPSEITDKCTFEISFTQDFCDTLQANDKIIVTYSATLNKNATVGTTGHKNKTWLKYGENTNLETTPSETTTKTYEIPVFKYTNTDSTKKALAGVVFELYRDEECTTSKKIEFVKIGTSAEGYECYRIATGSDTSTTTIPQITTSTEGKFKICGLDEDTYYLKEVTAPKGYNKLSAPVKITIGENGTITVNDTAITGTDVEVENKTGSILPHTGGMGTTLFYIFGAILVIGSGVVLITKKRMK